MSSYKQSTSLPRGSQISSLSKNMITDLDHFYNYKNLTKEYKNIYKILYSWKNNLDAQYYYTMNYKLIIDFIILYKIYYNKEKCKIEYNKNDFTDNIIPLYMNACEKKLGYGDCLEPNIKFIIDLSNAINKTPTFNEIYPKSLKNRTITLYRGFQYDRYGGFFKIINHSDIKVGSIITTPTFLSTTLIEKVATLFIRSDINQVEDPDGKKTIMWKITVPNKLLLQFQYSYLGNDININKINWDKIEGMELNDNFDTEFISNFETEILLNFGASLRCLSIKKNIFNDKLLGKMKYVLYHFEFLGYDKNYQNTFLNDIRLFNKCLSIRYKKTENLSYCKNPKRKLNCSII
jgi:hypothetical protein